jgi:dTDP-4-dehydrorhamnose 3,5-epimerase
MSYSELPTKGAFIIDPDRFEDERGFYAKGWDREEAAVRGLITEFAQTNMSYTNSVGTVRGLHYQVSPHPEAKLVTCTKGEIFDVIVDMRPGSETYRKWVGVVLSADSRQMLYVPEYFAHGFATLCGGSEVLYSSSNSYHPECERGIRYDDPIIGIRWPIDITLVSDKDRSWPDLEE